MRKADVHMVVVSIQRIYDIFLLSTDLYASKLPGIEKHRLNLEAYHPRRSYFGFNLVIEEK